MHNYKNKKEIDFQTLIFSVLHKWKTICVCTVLFVMVFGLSAVYQASNMQESQSEELTEENNEKIESIEIEIDALEKALDQQRVYNKESILMQIDPDHEKASSVHYSIYVENSENLYLIYQMYNQYVSTISSELIDAGKIDIDKKYLDEIVRIQVGYDGSANARYGTIALSVIHNNMEQCENITAMYEEALEKYANVVKKETGEFEFTKISETYRDIRDNSIETIQRQNNAVLGYDNLTAANDRIKKYKDMINSLTPTTVQQQSFSSYIVKGIIKGIVAGIFVGIIIIVLLTIFSDKIYYASDLQNMFGIDEIVCLEYSQKRKDKLFELEKRLSGKYPNVLAEDTVEKYVLYKVNKAISQNGVHKRVAILGDKMFDTQVVERIVKCCSTISNDLMQVVDNIADFRYTQSTDNYGGALILVREGFTTYKQVSEIIKVLEEKDIRIIGIIATMGEKE